MKKYLVAALASALLTCAVQAQTATPPNNNPPTINFNKSKDLFIAQFDSKPDPDDIHAIAGLGSMLAHPDLHNVDYYAVQGSVGKQGGQFIPAPALMNLAFGQQNVRWTQAGVGKNNTVPDTANWNASVDRVRIKAKAALDRGGNVYVMDAGNEDFTHDWVQELVNQTAYTTNDTKARIIVVQHSNWNEEQTSSAAVLNWVRNNTDYRRIADGNGANATPDYQQNIPQGSFNNSFITSAKAANNPNSHARALWVEADAVLQAHGHFPSYSSISRGGVDFSDCVEAWYIFNVGNNANGIQPFWNRYVRNTNSANGPVPGPAGGSGSGAPIGQTVALKSVGNGKYVAADRGLDAINWPLAANRTAVGAWEKFQVVDAGGGLIALKANGNGKFVASDQFLSSINWPMAANRTAVGAWEKFTWVENSDGTISLKANGNGKFIAADRGLDVINWPLAANRTAIGAWEKFTFEIQ
ncbi:MAG: hypothetical protein AAFX93_02360 [Verrucomicrobiota bacterium]